MSARRPGNRRARGAVRRLRHASVRWGMRLFADLLRLLRLSTAARIGSLAAHCWWSFAGRERLRTVAQLRQAFPERSPRWHRQIARRSFDRLCRASMMSVVLGLSDPARLDTLVEYDEWRAWVDRVAPGGIVAIAAHVGPFLLSAPIGSRCGRFDVVARPARLPHIEDLEQRMFANWGVEAFVQGQGLREMVRRIKRGGGVGMVPDHDVKRIGGAFVPYFGRLAYTPVGPAALARMTRAPMGLGLILPTSGAPPWRPHYTVRLTEVPAQDSGDRDIDLAENTRRWLAVLEGYVRLYPQEWTWMNRRWKTRPVDRPRAVVWRPEHNRDGWEPPPPRPV